jgi:hypothetical protein
VIEGLSFAIAGGLVFAMMAGTDALLYSVTMAGLVGSFVVGRLCVRHNWLPAQEGVKRYGMMWLWVIGCAALSLLNGKWEPMVFFGAVGAVMALIFWFGTRTAR